MLSEIYTAVTRARTNLFVVCDEEAERILRTVIGDTLYKKLTEDLNIQQVHSYSLKFSILIPGISLNSGVEKLAKFHDKIFLE